MIEFAEMVGARQSTISRYEAGKLLPRRPALLLMLQLAEAEERWPILNALGVCRESAEGWSELRLIEALRTFERYIEAAGSKGETPLGLTSGRSLELFAAAAKKAILEYQDIDLSVSSIVTLWLKHGRNPEAVKFFRHAEAYLKVELTTLASASAQRKHKGKHPKL
jgi:transcriptional regulator with XRE-family HTH domain